MTVGCKGCRVGCDSQAACPFGCFVEPLTGLDGFCRKDCNHTTQSFYPRNSPRLCTTDIRDYLDGKVNQRCVSGWRKRAGPAAFGCRPIGANGKS